MYTQPSYPTPDLDSKETLYVLNLALSLENKLTLPFLYARSVIKSPFPPKRWFSLLA